MLHDTFDLDVSLINSVPDGAFIGPHDLEGTISLETAIGNPFVVDQEALLTTWGHLSAVSVEAACSGHPDLFEFTSRDSLLLFAAIRTPVKIPLTPNLDFKRPDLTNHAAMIHADSPISPTDPAAIYDLVDRYHKQLHSPPLSSLDNLQSASFPTSSQHHPGDALYKWETTGILYVTQSPFPSEVYIGVGLLPAFRGQGLGIKACAFAVQWAIETIDAHRVQARILASPDRSRAQRLFTALGFTHEGVQRRAAPNAAGAWVDVTCMGVVDTDWVMRRRLRAVPRNLWDELFARHQREREELLRWEETQGRGGVRRTSSMETVREHSIPIPEMMEEESDSGSECGTPPTSSSASASDRSPSPKREGSELPEGWEHPWRSPLSVPSAADSDLDDPFSDSEWVLDDIHSSQEPVPRPPSSSSWSSFESVGSAHS